MTESQSIMVSGTVDAPVERVFALLADPDRHTDLDASGMLQGAETHHVITERGDVFEMRMESPARGAYHTENHVVVFEQDRALGWAPALPGQEPAGHTYVWRLEPEGDDRTRVSQTYDWSAVTDETVEGYCPAVSTEQLADSIRRLGRALA